METSTIVPNHEQGYENFKQGYFKLKVLHPVRSFSRMKAIPVWTYTKLRVFGTLRLFREMYSKCFLLEGIPKKIFKDSFQSLHFHTLHPKRSHTSYKTK